MKQKLVMLIRILFGLLFFVMGLNIFFHFITLPPMSLQGSAFMTALSATGYMLTMIAIVEIVAGFMLMFNIWVPLALVLLAPLIVNITLFHIFLDPTSLGLAIVLVIVELFLAFVHWDHFAHLFKRR